MEAILRLLQDGHARTIPMLAVELHTSEKDVMRQIEYLEQIGRIRRVFTKQPKCSGCTGCSDGRGGKKCSSCMPEGGFQNMGQMWEVVSS